MSYFLFLLGLCFLVGLVGVAANPSPHFGVVGLVVGVAGGVGGLIVVGGSFVGVFIFNLFGGDVGSFAYPVALAAEPFPAAWGDWSVVPRIFVCGLLVGFVIWLVGGVMVFGGQGLFGLDSSGLYVLRGDVSGVAGLFLAGGPLLVLCGWGLMLTLFVVLELVRGWSCGGLRCRSLAYM
uniref:NADH-ubiquinone oxidoreductase chain 6 n=1 Tax=Cyrtodactylus thirakhupti TaxID=2002800 RepID=A0A3G9DN32_9SAUR|nr:NADH dehydrogenase subunit 6 [Cyrtodactylus thirakhupti]